MKRGDPIEIFNRMPFGLDNGQERLDIVGDRWVHCPLPKLGTNRPRTGWTERWLPGTVIEGPDPKSGSDGRVRFSWDIILWFDWASGEQVDSSDPHALTDQAPLSRVRPRSVPWNLEASHRQLPRAGNELNIGGAPVSVSFIVFRWGAAKIPIQYDSHSWGRTEGSTVSARFMQLFFDRAVIPKLGFDYEVLSVFMQHSDEFAGVSPEFLASLCRGKSIVALYFLWPIQQQQSYGDRDSTTACYLESAPFYDLVLRMEGTGIVTRWPHHSHLWKSLTSKEWVPGLSIVPKYHVPLTTRVPKSLILRDAKAAAKQALKTLWILQNQKRCDDTYQGPLNSDWVAGQGAERCVAKLGYSYEGVDVKMVAGEDQLVDALYRLVAQAGYTNDCVYVQQRVQRLDLEARCFVVDGQIVDILYTRFARIDRGGFVRDYEKAHSAEEAMRQWFYNDQTAWQSAHNQIVVLSRRWFAWMLTQAAEPTVSVRIDYMLHRVVPGLADVWTGEVGEQGYSMGGIDPVIVFNKVLESILAAPL